MTINTTTTTRTSSAFQYKSIFIVDRQQIISKLLIDPLSWVYAAQLGCIPIVHSIVNRPLPPKWISSNLHDVQCCCLAVTEQLRIGPRSGCPGYRSWPVHTLAPSNSYPTTLEPAHLISRTFITNPTTKISHSFNFFTSSLISNSRHRTPSLNNRALLPSWYSPVYSTKTIIANLVHSSTILTQFITMSADKKPFLTERESEVLTKSWLCMKAMPEVRIV